MPLTLSVIKRIEGTKPLDGVESGVFGMPHKDVDEPWSLISRPRPPVFSVSDEREQSANWPLRAHRFPRALLHSPRALHPRSHDFGPLARSKPSQSLQDAGQRAQLIDQLVGISLVSL